MKRLTALLYLLCLVALVVSCTTSHLFPPPELPKEDLNRLFQSKERAVDDARFLKTLAAAKPQDVDLVKARSLYNGVHDSFNGCLSTISLGLKNNDKQAGTLNNQIAQVETATKTLSDYANKVGTAAGPSRGPFAAVLPQIVTSIFDIWTKAKEVSNAERNRIASEVEKEKMVPFDSIR